MAIRIFIVFLIIFYFNFPVNCQKPEIPIVEKKQLEFFKLYPDHNSLMPVLPSPFQLENGEEYVIALTKEGKYAIIPVTIRNDRGIVSNQKYIAENEFPSLLSNGLHDEKQLKAMQEITGRSIKEINKLALPGGLSTGGFIAEDESIISVMLGDNELVKKMNLTHPLLAKCLYHILNMMDEDLKLGRWNMAYHEWQNICYFYYNRQRILVRAYDTKGGQQSIFNDGLTGAFHIKIKKDPRMEELIYLQDKYSFLDETQFKNLIAALSTMNIGEINPQYIMRYGFYEGHTYWRSDPIAIAYIFGLKSIEELDKIFEGKLHEALLTHHIPGREN